MGVTNTNQGRTVKGTSYVIGNNAIPDASLDDIEKREGRIVYDNTDKEFVFWNGTEWISLNSTASLSAEDLATLEHFKYNPETDQLEADRSIETTLSSLYLGKQHGIHSAGENVVFTNESTKVNWFPVWTGISKGLQYKATTRVYTDLQLVEETEDANYVQFRELYPNPNSVSVFGFKIRLGQSLSQGETLRYNVYYYNGSQTDTIGSSAFNTSLSTQIYEQDILVDRNYSVGELFELEFVHPVEVHAGQVIYDELKINGSNDFLLVKDSTTPNVVYQQIELRLFEDKEIATLEDLSGIVSGSQYKGSYDASQDLPSLPTGSDAQGDTYRVNVTGNGYEVGDLLIFNGTDYDHIPVKAVTQDSLAQSSLNIYDWYVKPSYVGVVTDGKAHTPFTTVQQAINASSEGESIFIDGIDNISSEILLPHGLHFYGSEGSEIRYATFDATNGNIFKFEGNGTQELSFDNIIFRNAGGYAIHIKKTDVTELRNCRFYNNAWNGQGLHTVASKDITGLAGYDSSQMDLQSFYASSNVGDGGAVRIEECRKPMLRENRAEGNLRGFRLQDCGINGGGFVIENQSIGNLDSGIYLAVGSLNGCQNITVTINYSAYNANNGLLVVGGLNNKFSQNEVFGNWNAGLCAWGAANTTLRDSGLYNNNRSQYNGIGNVGDAKASIQINDSSSYLETSFQTNENARFIAEILDTQVHYTGLGSNTDKVGVFLDASMSNIPDNEKNIIKIDDVGFIGQDYAMDFGEVDITNLRVTLGDNSYLSIGKENIRSPLGGMYAELPFSNHITSVKELDIRIDTVAKSVTLVEGLNGKVINVYKKNELQAIDMGTHVDIIQRDSNRVQLRGNLLGNVYINGVTAGSNVPTMVEEINDAVDLTITEYKDFIETEVGVEGSEQTTTWYYIEYPSGVYHYPLFKTVDEANLVDTELGGSGTSHTHTYPSDLSNTTWYMPDSNNHMSSSDIPTNGLFGVIPNVIWNIWNTDTSDPVNPAPTFGDATYNVLEGNYVNIAYRDTNDSDSYSITNLPSWISDNGNALTGYAPNNISSNIQYVIDVTRSNGNGSDSGIITLNIYNDAGNDSTNDTTWNHAISFTGTNKYAYQNSTGNSYNPLRMGGISSSIDIDAGGAASTHTSNNAYARPWQVGIVFKHDGNSSNQTIWGQCEGNSTSHDNIMITIDANKNCYFQWGYESGGYNKKFLGNIPSHTWVGLSVIHKGQRWKNPNSNALGETFQFNWVDLATGEVLDTIYGNSNLLNTNIWSDVGRDMARQVLGTFTVGGRLSNRSFKGDVASVVVTTLRRNVAIPTDTEISMMIRDPKKWLTDYKIGQSYRSSAYNFDTSNFQLNNNSSAWSTKVWLMGDGTNDSYSNMIRNQVYPNDQNYTMLRLNNMQSTDIVSASIAGITNNANIVNFSGNNYSFGSDYYDGYIIDITSTGNWSFILPELDLLPTDYTVTVRNITNTTFTGSIVPYGSESIDGVATDKVVGGKVDITLRKENNNNWEIVSLVQYEQFEQEQSSSGTTTTINQNYSGGNVNTVFDFTNSDTIVLNHNLGGVPIIQVWIDEGNGEYTDASVDIDHEWSSMMTSTINIGTIESGKIVYIYNS